MTSPANTSTAAERAEFVKYACEIRSWQIAQRPEISNRQMVAKFSKLGSDRSYKRAFEADTSDISDAKIGSWVAKYRAVCAELELIRAAASSDDALYLDLEPAEEVRVAIAGLTQQRGNQRVVVITGGNGAGKTKCLQAVAHLFPGVALTVEAGVGWRSPGDACADIAAAVEAEVSGPSSRKNPVRPGEWIRAICDKLEGSRRIIMIDEGQHMSREVFNIIKTLVNRTECVFVIAAIDTLFDKLAGAAWEEARQVLQNRLFCRVNIPPPSPSVCAAFIKARTGAEFKSSEMKTTAAAAAKFGALGFVRRVAEKLAERDERDDTALTECVADAIADLTGN